MKYVLGFSGGIDSTFAAYKLKQQGHEVLLVNFSVNEKLDKSTINNLQNISEKLGLELISLDLSKDFKEKIIKIFIEYYKQGKTPNPCVWCNPLIKFHILEEIRLQRGFDAVITGHYAQISKINNKNYISVAQDISKDQSYVLYKLSQTQNGKRLLDNVHFMLGNELKSEIKNILKNEGLVLDFNQKESQDICFIPDNDYSAFIVQNSSIKYPEGNIVNLDGKRIGKHKGIINYTIGQRSGLGINQKFYVVDIDIAKNLLIVGNESDLYKDSLISKDFFIHDELICDNDFLDGKIIGKIRYRHLGEKIKSIQKVGNDYKIIFEKSARAITRGQHLVLYKVIEGQNVVIGGGEIY